MKSPEGAAQDEPRTYFGAVGKRVAGNVERVSESDELEDVRW
jgi:hypothetical protein